MIILFKKTELLKLKAQNNLSGLIIHAHPLCQAYKVSGIQEHYLDGYGTPADGLTKITMNEIASSLNSYKRIELL